MIRLDGTNPGITRAVEKYRWARVENSVAATARNFIPAVFNVSIQIDYYGFNKHEA